MCVCVVWIGWLSFCRDRIRIFHYLEKHLAFKINATTPSRFMHDKKCIGILWFNFICKSQTSDSHNNVCVCERVCIKRVLCTSHWMIYATPFAVTTAHDTIPQRCATGNKDDSRIIKCVHKNIDRCSYGGLVDNHQVKLLISHFIPKSLVIFSMWERIFIPVSDK